MEAHCLHVMVFRVQQLGLVVTYALCSKKPKGDGGGLILRPVTTSNTTDENFYLLNRLLLLLFLPT